MATVDVADHAVGATLRDWRQRRRLSQLELALDAGVSTRHLSCVETGRSRPGRALILRLAEELGVPFRERNRLLLQAGFAPAFPERPLSDPELAPVRDALDRILAAHEPYPALVMDRGWNLVAANAASDRLVEGVDPTLLEPPINLLELGLALVDRILNLEQILPVFRERLGRQAAITGDGELAGLLDQLGPVEAVVERDVAAPLGPMRWRAPDGGEWAFFGMFGTFDTPFEVTTSELALELLFPADAATAEALRKRGDGR